MNPQQPTISTPWYPNSFPGCPAEQKLIMAFRRTLNFVDTIHADVQKILNPVTPKGAIVTPNIVVIEDVRANLNLYEAADYPLGSLIFFTDWFVTYINRLVNAAPTWRYMTGEYNAAVSTFAGLGLGANDAGLVLNDTALKHRYQWTGTAFQFAQGDEGSGKYVPTIGPAPTGGVWHLADGTAGVQMSVGDGTVTTVTVKNLNAKRLIGADTAYAEIAGAPATWQGGARTDDESAHTHDMNGHVHSVSITVVANTTVQSGSGATIAGAQVDSTTSGGPSPTSTAAGTAHHHTLSNGNALLNIPSDGNGGIGDHTWMVWWVRQ